MCIVLYDECPGCCSINRQLHSTGVVYCKAQKAKIHILLASAPGSVNGDGGKSMYEPCAVAELWGTYQYKMRTVMKHEHTMLRATQIGPDVPSALEPLYPPPPPRHGPPVRSIRSTTPHRPIVDESTLAAIAASYRRTLVQKMENETAAALQGFNLNGNAMVRTAPGVPAPGARTAVSTGRSAGARAAVSTGSAARGVAPPTAALKRAPTLTSRGQPKKRPAPTKNSTNNTTSSDGLVEPPPKRGRGRPRKQVPAGGPELRKQVLQQTVKRNGGIGSTSGRIGGPVPATAFALPNTTSNTAILASGRNDNTAGNLIQMNTASGSNSNIRGPGSENNAAGNIIYEIGANSGGNTAMLPSASNNNTAGDAMNPANAASVSNINNGWIMPSPALQAGLATQRQAMLRANIHPTGQRAPMHMPTQGDSESGA